MNKKMTHPFELDRESLNHQLDDMVDATFSDIQSEFLVLPRGSHLVEYQNFQAAYEVLKIHTKAFSAWDSKRVWEAARDDSLVLLVLRTILGVSPPEWADLVRDELGLQVPQSAARTIDVNIRKSNRKTGDRDWLAKLKRNSKTAERVKWLIDVAVKYTSRGAPHVEGDAVHRLGKIDTQYGLDSLRHVAAQHVPYAVLLYERYLGRPFASHRDSVSEKVGDVMENAIEERLVRARISHRKTGRAERVPGFEQAPDFFIPDEVAPTVIVEAKITSDDGTARDKVARILRLANMRDEQARNGKIPFQVVACVDGRGFGVRRQNMRDMLAATHGKVFTLATLEKLIPYTDIAQYCPHPSPMEATP